MYVVGVGLVKVYKALIRLAGGTLHPPLSVCVSPFSDLNTTATQKLLSYQAWSLILKLNLLQRS